MFQHGSVCGEKVICPDDSIWCGVWFAWDEDEVNEFQIEYLDDMIAVLQDLKRDKGILVEESYQITRELE